MMRLSARQDLRDNYAKIHVTALDKELRRKPVTVSIAISDPGPIRQSDLVVLAPGHAETFEHHGEPYDLAALEPGTYEATVDVTPDIGAPDELNSMQGSFIPFPRTRADRDLRHDPRLSIQERYPGRADFLQKIEASARELAAGGYLLADDIPHIVEHSAIEWDFLDGTP